MVDKKLKFGLWYDFRNPQSGNRIILSFIMNALSKWYVRKKAVLMIFGYQNIIF